MANNEKRKLLICDDDNLLRPLLIDYFSAQGFDVTAAIDGIDCLEKVSGKEDEYCAYLLDIKMPRLDGVQAATELRHRSTEAPIIFMSGYSDVISTEQIASLGVARFFTKPYSIVALGKDVLKICASADGEKPECEDSSLKKWF